MYVDDEAADDGGTGEETGDSSGSELGSSFIDRSSKIESGIELDKGGSATSELSGEEDDL